jgi:hypothetical protein
MGYGLSPGGIALSVEVTTRQHPRRWLLYSKSVIQPRRLSATLLEAQTKTQRPANQAADSIVVALEVHVVVLEQVKRTADAALHSVCRTRMRSGRRRKPRQRWRYRWSDLESAGRVAGPTRSFSPAQQRVVEARKAVGALRLGVDPLRRAALLGRVLHDWLP